nr:deoxyribodipyrimidine photo-lyase [Motiliproteus sediminis]
MKSLVAADAGRTDGEPAWRGGRSEALSLLDAIDTLSGYAERRDLPAERGTSRLSAHLKFGTCSVREVYYRVLHCWGEDHPLLRQLHWRDFFTQIAWHYPQVFGQPFDRRLTAMRWPNEKAKFEAWCQGRTGFPIVDAGMRELNHSGYMHNRLRMIVASFLVKDLHVDWRWGERYFAQRLIDYDPCVNNGSWQWAASTGCDAQPWFRIFNPWRQQQRFDPEGEYIRSWVPELAGLGAKALLQLECGGAPAGYPEPIVDHKSAALWSKESYRQALAAGNDQA